MNKYYWTEEVYNHTNYSFIFLVVPNYLSILINQEMSTFISLLYPQLITLKMIELFKNVKF